MEQLIEQMGQTGGILVLLIPPLMQLLKKVQFIVKLQADGNPAFEILSIAIGIGGAFALGLPAPIVTGVVAGLAAGKGYDFAKGKNKIDTRTIANP